MSHLWIEVGLVIGVLIACIFWLYKCLNSESDYNSVGRSWGSSHHFVSTQSLLPERSSSRSSSRYPNENIVNSNYSTLLNKYSSDDVFKYKLLSDQQQQLGVASLKHEYSTNTRYPKANPTAPSSSSIEYKKTTPIAPSSSSVEYKKATPIAPSSSFFDYKKAITTATSSSSVEHKKVTPTTPSSSSFEYKKATSTAPSSSFVDYKKATPIVPSSSSVESKKATPTTPSSSFAEYKKATTPIAPSFSSIEYKKATPVTPSSSSVDYKKATPTTPSSSFVESKKATPIYKIPENILQLIKTDVIPQVLHKPLSPSTYKDYFASLLYAEDHYMEKWSEFCLLDVTLKLQKSSTYEKPSRGKNMLQKGKRDDKLLVAFEIDSIPENRPFLLSRDYVFLVRRSRKKVHQFQGILSRVVKRTLVLVEFGDDFHYQHHPEHKYDVSFSFNRVCLKRCHNAIETAASNPTLCKFLFPDPITDIHDYMTYSRASSQAKEGFAIHHLSTTLKCARPFLIEGPPSVTCGELSKTGLYVREMILQVLRSSPNSHVLVCAPTNNTCDAFTRSLKMQIPESDIFRANAVFRDLDDVPDDILSACSYQGECFTCPLENLKNVRVIVSTFMTSFRLKTEGISSGHFSHTFMVDASFATEPEAMVTLANLAGEETCVVVTGTEKCFPGLVRSDIGRRYGLQKSYFQRLFERVPYSNLHPALIRRIKG